MLLYKYFAIKYELRRLTGLLPLSLSSPAIIAANGKITKVMDSEKEETMKNCRLAWPKHSSYSALSFSAYTESNNALCRREVWLVSHSQPLFLQSTGKRGWLYETNVWPHKTRRTAAKRGEYASIFPAVKIELVKYDARHEIW